MCSSRTSFRRLCLGLMKEGIRQGLAKIMSKPVKSPLDPRFAKGLGGILENMHYLV